MGIAFFYSRLCIDMENYRFIDKLTKLRVSPHGEYLSVTHASYAPKANCCTQFSSSKNENRSTVERKVGLICCASVSVSKKDNLARHHETKDKAFPEGSTLPYKRLHWLKNVVFSLQSPLIMQDESDNHGRGITFGSTSKGLWIVTKHKSCCSNGEINTKRPFTNHCQLSWASPVSCFPQICISCFLQPNSLL
jgi:hypothetical protein